MCTLTAQTQDHAMLGVLGCWPNRAVYDLEIANIATIMERDSLILTMDVS